MLIDDIKKLYRITKQRAYNIMYKLQWRFSKNRRSKSCLNMDDNNRERIIVSLTTFPDRINIVKHTIHSILNQRTVKPSEVILWLAESQFPEKEKALPGDLLNLSEYGLTINWCKDIRSYKKLIPTLGVYKDDIIVTTDDDAFYGRDWLEKLYKGYLEHRDCIQCHRVTKFIFEDDSLKTIPGGFDYYNEPSYLNKLVGVGGVLYPPHSLYKDICNSDIFMDIAPTNDDIWFWIMGVLNKTKVNVVKNNVPMPIQVLEAGSTPELSDVNDHGDKLFWVQLENILNYYPEAKARIFDELNLRRSSK